MGQAKKRGSFEERQAEAVEAARLRQVERDRKEQEFERIKAERWAKLSPEEKEKALKKAKNDMQMMAMLMGLANTTYDDLTTYQDML